MVGKDLEIQLLQVVLLSPCLRLWSHIIFPLYQRWQRRGEEDGAGAAEEGRWRRELLESALPVADPKQRRMVATILGQTANTASLDSQICPSSLFLCIVAASQAQALPSGIVSGGSRSGCVSGGSRLDPTAFS
jgi:hypothetical protein